MHKNRIVGPDPSYQFLRSQVSRLHKQGLSAPALSNMAATVPDGDPNVEAWSGSVSWVRGSPGVLSGVPAREEIKVERSSQNKRELE